MDLIFRLPGLRVADVHETFEEVRCTVEVVSATPSCPACKKKRLGPHGTLETSLADVPIRGKRTVLIVRRQRFQCKCGATCSEPVPPVADPTFPSLTLRLARYIENQSLRRPMTHISAEVGVSKSVIRRLVKALADRLYVHHRFPTPELLGIDDIRIRQRLFTNITDGRTGHSIALVDSGEALKIQQEMNRRKIDANSVKVVVSDMGGSNIAVFKELFDGTAAIHVADKWHVLKGAKEALNAVINKHLNDLRQARAASEKLHKTKGTLPPKNPKDPKYRTKPPYSTHPLTIMQNDIDDLRHAKRKLLGMRRPFYASKQLTLNDYQMIVKPMCLKHRMVGHAFVATMRLHAVYDTQRRINRRGASANVDLFLRLASVPDIEKQFKVIVERVKTHREIILNYYDAIAVLPAGQSAPTTGPTEQRNSTIKRAWSAARGIKDHHLFSMRALYEPWHLDVDIAVCTADKCTTVDGPFPGQAAARRARLMQPLHAHRCANCP